MIGSLLTFLAVGLATLIVAGIVLSILSTVLSIGLGLAAFLIFKVAPVLLLGWVVLKVIDKRSGGGSLSAADRRWLEGD
jgi:hypothetical protein